MRKANPNHHRATEQRLLALGNKRYYRALVLTVVWLALVVTAFVAYMIALKRSFAEPQNYLILLLAILPFFPFGAHKVLLSKTFYATVDYNVNTNQFEGLEWAGTRNRPEKVAVLEITFRRDDGKKITVAYKKNPYPGKGLHYADGDRVLFIRGLKYPCKLTAAEKLTCPLCGTTVETESPVCRGCRLDLTE